MTTCRLTRARFSAMLDGTLSGREMQQFARHTADCGECHAEFGQWRQMQAALGSLGTAAVPADLALRLRVALSHARAASQHQIRNRWHTRWQNTVRPLALQWSAGLATAIVVLTAAVLMVGMVAAPGHVQASTAPSDEPVGMAVPAHYLYSMLPSAALHTIRTDVDSPVVVEAYLGADGRVYDYKIVAGEDTPEVRAQLNNALYFAVFAPARVFGRAVPGHAVMSFAGVAVHG